ncbi:OmpA family protein [Dyella sp. C11]|uniref:OmpA family protein n=1 Tax=Dyella sp. C11 TaxID=2126991 RepID=UPI000D65A547|nr:OmpA family protein [Dyella sp. C11]
MVIHIRSMKFLSLALAVVVGLSACGNVSKNVRQDGQSADSLHWPAMTDTTPMHKGGTFPSLDSLAKIHAGLNKQQIADLIGYPHFSEGVWGVREWNYVFNFRDPANGDIIRTCQYKVLFDQDKLAKSFYWHPNNCAVPATANVLAPAAAVAPQPAPKAQRFELSGDTLFPLGRYRVEDMLPGGREQLDNVAARLRESPMSQVKIIGHTDMIGDSESNMVLSRNRAESVRAYLVSHGVAPEVTMAVGMGKAQPVKQCDTRLDRASLVQCLQPNRRVEIVATGVSSSTSS